MMRSINCARLRLTKLILSLLVLLVLCGQALAATIITVTGPGGTASQTVPDEGGPFDLNLPLNRNAVNKITVTATDKNGQTASQDFAVTQVSLDAIVVSRVTSERLSTEQVRQLVSEGVIQLDNPENFNVSKFDIVLTIANNPVPISIPVAVPKDVEQTGYEVYKMPQGDGSGGGGKPPENPPEIVIFDQPVQVEEGQPPISIPGVIIIEGRIKSLKEFYSVRLLLMNTSGIFTLKNVMSSIEFPDGGLSRILPADGIVSFNDILPGDGGQPGQVEKEFIIRGDEIGIRNIKVSFGGSIAGPGIPEDELIPFNGSAFTSVEVKGPPTFRVQVIHPDTVVKDQPYELKVDITNTGDIAALYTSLDLDVGADAVLLKCSSDADGNPVCAEITGPDVRSFGDILPGKTASAVFTVKPLKTGVISSCLGISDQNISLQVLVGNNGCIVGTFPPVRGVPDGVPTVTAIPGANATGISIDSPVTAFFSELMNMQSITTGAGGSFNVYDKTGNRVAGIIRFEEINSKTIAVWQVNDPAAWYRLAPNMEYTVVLTKDMKDLDGNSIFNEWTSRFSTTGVGADDVTPPTVTLSIEPPVNPNFVLPGQIIRVNVYTADQGSGVARVELRIKDMDEEGSLYTLVDQKTVFSGDRPPYIFSIDSGRLVPGHVYQLMSTAYDANGNAQNATISVFVAAAAVPPTITLPADPGQDVLHGISVDVTPLNITGGVSEVRFYLDGSGTPFKTVTLSPYQASVRTLNLGLGAHAVRAVAVDGLGQTGEDTLAFNLVENRNMPIVHFGGLADGTQVLTGATMLVAGGAEDPVGIRTLKYYFDSPDTLIYSGTAPILLNTTGIGLGEHTLFLVATNNLDISNDINDPDSALTFSIVEPPPAPPPAAPSVTSVSYPENGKVTVQGLSVANARIDITDRMTGFTFSVTADGSGAFSARLDASAGDVLSLVAYDLAISRNPSTSTEVTVQAAPLLVSIEAAPVSMSFDAVSQYRDIIVTGHYENGSTANLTAQASFSSDNSAVATVSSAGRVVAQSYGSAVITITVQGRQASVTVTCTIITLTGISVTPTVADLFSIEQQAQLAVTGHYSDGSSAPLNTGISYITGNQSVASVNSSGLVTAVGNGVTQINVYHSGVPAVSVTVNVNSDLDPAPTLEILSPADGTEVERNQSVTVTVKALDTFGGVNRLHLAVSGQTVYSEMKQIAPSSLDVTRSFTFTISDAAVVGGTVTVQAWAEDTSGNLSTARTLTLNIVDRTAPAVTINAPVNQTAFNYGDTVNISVSATDDVGISQVRYQTSGALSLSGFRAMAPASKSVNTVLSFAIPYGVAAPDVRITAYASDAAGNERSSVPVNIIITNADITPPETVVTSVAAPGAAATTVTYQVTSGLEDLDHVELYFRRNGLGTFNLYTNTDAGSPEGTFFPQSGSTGTIAFDSTKMGGDGSYEFYAVGVDRAGNREGQPKDGGTVVADRTAEFNAGTLWTTISIPTVINAGDTTYDNRNLRISATTLTVIGHHAFKNLDLMNGAVLTQSETDLTNEYSFDISAWTLSIDSASSINVDGRGYLGGNRGGNDASGQTVGNTNGSAPRTGGSYGGPGGVFDGGPANPVYGNLVNPVDLGSGGSMGCNGNYPGGDGGGRIQLQAINLVLDGTISANGASGGGCQAGSGSGGSFNAAVSSLSGSGIIRSNGGGYEVGGGGGRIAINYVDMSTMATTSIIAVGGQGSNAGGGNGTVFLKSVRESNGTLIVDGQGASSAFSQLPIPPGYIFDSIEIRSSARVVVDSPLVVNEGLRVLTGSILTHSLSSEAGLSIQAKRVEVDGTSSIDVSSKGYRGGYKDGNGLTSGITLGGLAGAATRSGGSYGGYGGVFDGSGSNLPYGHPAEPLYLGSGGSMGCNGNYPGGNGGGLIKITATESVVVNGSLLANGERGYGCQAGSGSGGSIKIDTSLLKGTGTIAANGGVFEVGGGGGRIAVTYDYLGDAGEDFGGLRDISTFAGHGSNAWGSAGTVLLRRNDQTYGDLYIDDNMGSATSALYTPLSRIGYGRIVGLTEDTITTDGTTPMAPNGLVGQEINPDQEQTQTYRIVSNTETTLTVDTTGKPNLTAVAGVNDSYVGVYRFDNVYFRRGGFLVLGGEQLIVGDTLKIDEYGRLTHYDATMNLEPFIDLTVGRLELSATGSINVDGRGYLGGNRGGNDATGQTVGNTNGSAPRTGGSYGGLGGVFDGGPANPIYGSLTDPAALGSGGSTGCNGSYPGGDGGGWVAINAGAVVLDGVITANGDRGNGCQSGSGSGGTVNINTATLSGSGTITANGAGYEVGGGGGRIAIRYNSSTLNPANAYAIGGSGSNVSGGNGTVSIEQK